jgi:hypothetical protein
MTSTWQISRLRYSFLVEGFEHSEAFENKKYQAELNALIATGLTPFSMAKSHKPTA